MDYTPREMMAIAAGRFVSDGDILFAGTGVALLAAVALFGVDYFTSYYYAGG